MASIISAGTTSGTSLNLSGDTSGVLQLASNGSTTAVTIDTAQQVGIGIASPSRKLQVHEATAATNAYFQLSNAATGSGATDGFQAIVGTGGEVILAQRENAEMQFWTNNTERMRIDSSGNLLVGATGQISSEKLGVTQSANSQAITISATNASYTADAFIVYASRNTTNNSFYVFNYFNTGASAYKFRVADSGNVTNTNNSYGSISDIKLKENIVDASPKLEKLCQVKVRNFNIIGDEQKQLGVVAQELEQIFPSMIEESPDKDIDGNDLGTTTKLVKYSVFVPMLIKAMQEQQAMITELNAKVEAQAVRIAELEGAK
jgi:hypothetical protein